MEKNMEKNMKRVIIDTNALMAIAEMRIDVFSEIERICDFPYEIYVLEGTIKELEKIMVEQRLKYKRMAKLALALLRAKKISVLPSLGGVDDYLVRCSEKGDVVLTQDMELKKRLQRPYMTIRQGKWIVVVT